MPYKVKPTMPVTRLVVALGLLALAMACASSPKSESPTDETDPYASFVWPPPPDPPRIRLIDILRGRPDIEASSKLQRALIGASPQGEYDWLKQPHGVAIDGSERILVSDPALGAILRFDRANRRMDVIGTTGASRLAKPMGLGLGPDDTIYVADLGLQRVLSFDSEGRLKAVYGRGGDLSNPTDAAVSPDGTRLLVTDSKAQAIVIFDLATGNKVGALGERGTGQGRFNFPTSLAFAPDGNLLVVDQLNCLVQVFTPELEFLDEFGGRGVGYGNFVRPKDVVVDEAGLVYVTDAAFNNLQIFDAEARLLTFVGSGGRAPGQFDQISGVAVRGDELVLVDQLNHRIQILRFVGPKIGE